MVRILIRRHTIRMVDRKLVLHGVICRVPEVDASRSTGDFQRIFVGDLQEAVFAEHGSYLTYPTLRKDLILIAVPRSEIQLA